MLTWPSLNFCGTARPLNVFLLPAGWYPQVSVILSAAAEGPMELDDCVQTLGKADLLDSDLTEYVASLITAEVSRVGDAGSSAVLPHAVVYRAPSCSVMQ